MADLVTGASRDIVSVEAMDPARSLGIGVTVARLTLDQLVMVRIHDPQLGEQGF